MPSTSKQQAKTMTAACKNAEFRKKVDIPKQVACKFHNADRGKYHEEETMNDETISEKVKLQHALKTEDGGETEFRSDDIGRMKRLAGINQKLDADKEDGVVNFDGIFTGVANGEIPVSEGEYTFLKSLSEGLYEGCDNPDCHCKNCPGEGKCACGATNESIEIDEDVLGDKMKSKTDADLQKIVDNMENEEVSGSAAAQYRAAQAELKRRKKTNESEEVDESEMNRIRELAGMSPQITEYPGPEDDYDDMIRFTIDNERVHEIIMATFGEHIEHDGDEMTVPESLWGKVQEVAFDNGGEAIEAGNMDDGQPSEYEEWQDHMGGDDWDHGQYESEMFPEGSLSRHMIEMIVDEMNKGKESEEISEELSFDVDHVARIVEFVKEACGKKHKKGMYKEETEEDLDEDAESYLANRDAAIKERIANATNKEEIDETGDEEVDEEELTEMPMGSMDDPGHGYRPPPDDDYDYDEGLESYLSQKACQEATPMFLEALTGRHGWAIGEQARNICKDGQPFEEQNPNALRYIKEYAAANGLQTLAMELDQYLSMGESFQEEGSDEDLNRMMELSGIAEKKEMDTRSNKS